MKAVKITDNNIVVYLGENVEITDSGFIVKDEDGNVLMVNQSPSVEMAIVNVQSAPDDYEHGCYKHDGAWEKIHPTSSELDPLKTMMRKSNEWRELDDGGIVAWLNEADDDGLSRIDAAYSESEFNAPVLDEWVVSSIK